MSRTGYLIVSALIFALAAAGVLVWTNTVQLPISMSPQSAEKKLVDQMNEAVAGGGGYAVAFGQADVTKWQLGAGHRLERFSVEGGDAVFARLTSGAPLNKETWEWATQGLSTELPVQFNNQTNGKKIEIGIVARMSSANPSKTISVAYATQQAGNSGWQEIALSGDFALKTFTFDVPPLEPGSYTAKPILVIHADSSGGGAAAEILGVYVKQAK